MRVIKISEENHGLIGLAIDYEAARGYVIEKWLNKNSDVVIGENETSYECVSLYELYGEEWKEKLYEISFEDFETLLTDWFYFDQENLIE